MVKRKSQRVSLMIGYSVISSLMVFCSLVITKLTTDGNLQWSVGYFLGVLAISVGVGILIGGLTGYIVNRFVQNNRTEAILTEKKDTVISTKRIWLCSFFLIVLAWLPVFLAYYPGICAYDSPIQLGQIVRGEHTEHHPLFHTMLMQGCLFLGKNVWNSLNAGIVLMVILQSFLLAGAMAYGMSFLARFFQARKCSNKTTYIVLAVIQFCFMFCPFNAFMAASITKDVLYAAFILLQTISLASILQTDVSWKKGVDVWIFGLSSVGAMLFRNNGKYAMLVLLFGLFVAVIWELRKKNAGACFRKLFLGAIGCLAVSMVLLSMIASILNAGQGDKREMLSIPIQQLARTMIYHGGVGVLAEDDNTMSQEDKALINDFLKDESYKLYEADISDAVKRHTNTSVARYQAKRFLDTYLGLFLEYPGDYVNAFLAVNAGYLDILDTSHAKINLSDTEFGLGYVQTRWEEITFNEVGIYKDSKLPSLHAYLEQWAGTNGYLKLPILNLLMRPAIYFWICLGVAFTFLCLKKYRQLLLLCFTAGNYLTMFFGPTVQLRYVYPAMILVPFILCICALSIRRDIS